jgi:ABC-type branched-subunit amino acid transport system ATPase component
MPQLVAHGFRSRPRLRPINPAWRSSAVFQALLAKQSLTVGLSVADRTCVIDQGRIDQGRIVLSGTAAHVAKGGVVVDTYLGR